jgi:glycosyltransferase involved in cell wall biosynthesis
VAGSEADRRHAVKKGFYSEHTTAVVAPGVDIEYLAMPFEEQRENVVVYTGSWIPRKGIEPLCTVMNRVLKRIKDLRFELMGTGVSADCVLSRFLPELRSRINVRPRVSSSENAGALRTAKLFFFPTQYEGFGMTLAEAMACGCAAVTTPTGFGAELVNGAEAVVCEFQDITAMEQAIVKLLEDESRRLEIARNGWKRLQSLSWDANIKKLESIYSGWVTEFQRRDLNVTASIAMA